MSTNQGLIDVWENTLLDSRWNFKISQFWQLLAEFISGSDIVYYRWSNNFLYQNFTYA